MITEAQFERRLLHPKFWLLWAGVGLLKLLVKLPLSTQVSLGQRIGRGFKKFQPKRVKTVQRNIERCFPQMSATEQQQLLDANFDEIGMALFDTGNAWFWSDERIQQHMEIEGDEHLRAAQDAGHGVILLASHCLMLEPGARVFGQMHQGVGVYRPNKNPLLEYLQSAGRLRSNKGLIKKKEVRQMVKALRKGEVLWYTQDQDAGGRGVFANFFGLRCSTAPGAPALAKMGKAQVLPFFVERKADASGYRIKMHPPLTDFPSGDDQADVQRGNDETEKLVRMRPEQYMWLHRRFKTQEGTRDKTEFYR
ncbi:LpxL/LpxP family Kdo(2)-lipid IV(A) lauroyl/palmitoleoyl acyltransferase [Ferrimonas lipolytica]|uniref:Lipid A biosynthesis acyltransferase n=1 Tax=Ferrimonas lipolytica TaxID=2724191 RepID=A0A6H1UF82_9GAMM|nr:LpxL/LpxP family Kdo(2)-lipid IV(A) lauroyl/palmitoleoyl acyltransferase [Ferrimonas lipolytica]QIZ77741.1 LpxL/LpxP family Kdo(2)-lipid IV(A) lauroyl/palmitoleoyl acyltransferase [Ferrimonas lipolytica]